MSEYASPIRVFGQRPMWTTPSLGRLGEPGLLAGQARAAHAEVAEEAQLGVGQQR